MAKQQTIWVVDDDSELRQLLSTYLSEQGYEVRTLNDGKQFTARLEFQRPDLVVLDLMMPGDDGLTILRRLRDGGDDLPVVMLTARGEAVDRIIGLEQGADDYLAKPFMPRELSARIDAVLRRRGAVPAGTPVADGEVPVLRRPEGAQLALEPSYHLLQTGGGRIRLRRQLVRVRPVRVVVVLGGEELLDIRLRVADPRAQCGGLRRRLLPYEGDLLVELADDRRVAPLQRR